MAVEGQPEDMQLGAGEEFDHGLAAPAADPALRRVGAEGAPGGDDDPGGGGDDRRGAGDRRVVQRSDRIEGGGG